MSYYPGSGLIPLFTKYSIQILNFNSVPFDIHACGALVFYLYFNKQK